MFQFDEMIELEPERLLRRILQFLLVTVMILMAYPTYVIYATGSYKPLKGPVSVISSGSPYKDGYV